MKEKILKAIEKLKKESKKRNFIQSVDFSIVLKDVDLKNPENRIDEFLVLPNGIEKKVKVCAFVDKELTTEAKEICDKTITKDEFYKWAGKKKEIKKIAKEFDYFVAQATVMPDVATIFGKVLGPRGKMPNPKAGCVITPKTNFKEVIEKLRKTVRIKAKKQPVISTIVGTENMENEKIAENIIAVYDFVKKKLPRGEQQIKKKYVKLTMSKPVIL